MKKRCLMAMAVLALLGGSGKPAAAVQGCGTGYMQGCGVGCGACAPCVQYKIVYDTRQVQCYRTVYEKAYRNCTYTQCRPVYQTTYQECPQTICRPVVEFVERPYTCTVLKPVYRTVAQPRCRVVCKPVTTWCTYCVDQGHWQTPPPVCNPCNPCMVCQPCPVWVPNIVQKRVPVTRYVAQTVTETVNVQVCCMIPQQINRVARVPVCRLVQQNIVRRIPHTTCRIVTQQITRQVPYTVCRQVPYTVNVRVPRCVPFIPNGPNGNMMAPNQPMPQQTDADLRLMRIAAASA